MTDRLILTIVSIIMLILTVQKKEKYSIILTCGLTLVILITWTNVPKLISAGMLIYMIAALLITFYGIRKKEISKLERSIISISGIWAFMANLFVLNHYPYANEVRLSLIIPLILYLILIGKGIMKKKEFGFLTILNVEFLLRLLRFWN
jgi:predicted membrane protein